MTQERWDDIKGMIKDKFEVLENETSPLYPETEPTDNNKQKMAQKEILIFNGPMGKTKLEYIVKPVVLEKKEHYSRRAGTHSQSEYIFSETEFVRRMEAFKFVDDEWEKINAGGFES